MQRARRLSCAHSLAGRGRASGARPSGLEEEPVRSIAEKTTPKSIGQGMTFAENLVGEREISLGISMLSESVAERLRRQELLCSGVQIAIRNPQFQTISRQRALAEPTCLYREIYAMAMQLAHKNWTMTKPVRAITVTALGLGRRGEMPLQGSLFGPNPAHSRAETAGRGDLCPAQKVRQRQREPRGHDAGRIRPPHRARGKGGLCALSRDRGIGKVWMFLKSCAS